MAHHSLRAILPLHLQIEDHPPLPITTTLKMTTSLVKKVYQDDFSPARGNALQAAVASIFGLALHDVPNFIESPQGYDASIKCFYHERTKTISSSSDGGVDGGVCTKIKLEKMPSSNDDDNLYRGEKKNSIDGNDNNTHLEDFIDKICILRGKSPRGDFGHVVVARYNKGGRFEMMHDPHPEGTFLDESEEFGWCMFFT